LYRLLLIAQCNALHAAMPFLFERIDDETELLLPDNLMHSDSLIRKLVNKIDEEDWQEVEIIGWLYQFYISEKKDQVIGNVVKSEDIPAATRLFTPNWIVKYLVQNSLGRQWLATYPNSPLRQQMEYHIEPAEQTPEVQAQLKAITPESLNPEEITLLDPACGSGHILVEAYDLFKAIYQERGYRARDIPTLILHKNLFGLEIDDRAAQLAAFALMMKARADDRRIFTSSVQPNVLALQESKGLNAKELVKALNLPLTTKPLPPSDELAFMQDIRYPLFARERMGVKGDLAEEDIGALIELFADAKTFGSLIQVPPKLAEKLPAIGQRVRDVLAHGDLMMQPAAKVLLPLIEQAWTLSRQYDAVAANPPYMGSTFFNPILKDFINEQYKDAKADLYGYFIRRALEAATHGGYVSMITIPNWMFLSTFENLRTWLFDSSTVDSFIHNSRGVWGSDFGSCAFVFHKCHIPQFQACYRRLFDKQGSVASVEELEQRFFSASSYRCSLTDLEHLPGRPLTYWVSDAVRKAFATGEPLRNIAPTKVGQNTGDNDRFLRRWFEITFDKIGFGTRSLEEAIKSGRKWFPYNKGGQYRRWYGNNEFVINWENDGKEVKEYAVIRNNGKHWSRYLQNLDFIFKPGITWSFISSAYFGVRIMDHGFIFDVAGSSAFPSENDRGCILGFLSSKPATLFMAALNPTLNFQAGNVASLPFAVALRSVGQEIDCIVDEAVALSRKDWDAAETSWEFLTLPLLTSEIRANTVQSSWELWKVSRQRDFGRMQQLELENNRFFIEAYGLQGEFSPEVPEDQITLARPDREEDIKRLISYAIGCIMGRYSLAKPGLNHETNHEKHQIHKKKKGEGLSCDSSISWSEVDPDGIVPIMDADWFPDDAATRFVEFISVAWPKEHMEENLQFIAESLGPNRDEHPRDTVRHYLATSFFKDHLKTCKRRPIYWLFSSGKQRAFQCLVYLHRYHEGTLSRMRTEYVIPLQGKIAARIDHLASDIAAATSTSHRKKSEKERGTLLKQQAELQAFDEKLRHYADLRISLDLDDGVKVNYGKFGDLLAELKAVCGTEEE
jgi:hypothetical protein